MSANEPNVESPEALEERLLRIGQDCAERLMEPARSVDHGDLLYNDKGLPE